MLLSNRINRKSRIVARASSPSWPSLWLRKLGSFCMGSRVVTASGVLAPLVAIGRIDEREVEAFIRQRVVGKGAAEHDLKMAGGDFALRLQNEHIGAGDGPSLGIEFLPVEEDLGLEGRFAGDGLC